MSAAGLADRAAEKQEGDGGDPRRVEVRAAVLAAERDVRADDLAEALELERVVELEALLVVGQLI